jgi:hypothetical protein
MVWAIEQQEPAAGPKGQFFCHLDRHDSSRALLQSPAREEFRIGLRFGQNFKRDYPDPDGVEWPDQ